MPKIHKDSPVLRNPKFAQTIFDSARHPRAWLHVGHRLRASADIIFEHENPVAERFWNEFFRLAELDDPSSEEFDESKFPHPNFEAAYVILAFAIENFSKGIMVAKGVATFSKGELPSILKTHDLLRLHKLAKPNATISVGSLENLTYFSEWRGRYPMPQSIEQFWPMDDHGRPKIRGYSWSSFHSEILSYCDALETELRARCNDVAA